MNFSPLSWKQSSYFLSLICCCINGERIVEYIAELKFSGVIFLNTRVARWRMYWCNFHHEDDSSLRNFFLCEGNWSSCFLHGEWRLHEFKGLFSACLLGGFVSETYSGILMKRQLLQVMSVVYDLSIYRQIHSTCYTSKFKKSNEIQQYTDIYLVLNYSTCFGRPSRPSSGVYKTVVAASGTGHTKWGVSLLKRDQIRSHYLVTFEEACSPDSMICTRDCNYSFIYSWWWTRWTPETCRII